MKKMKNLLAVLIGLIITTGSAVDINANNDPQKINNKVNKARKKLVDGQKFKELTNTEIFFDDPSNPKMWPNWGNWGNWANWNNWNNWNNWTKWAKWNQFNNWGNY